MSSLIRRMERARGKLGSKLGVHNPDIPKPNSLPPRGHRRSQFQIKRPVRRK